MAVESPYAEVVGQRLVSMLVFDPWKGLRPGKHGPATSAIFGAIVLTFERAALICTSPLRYLRSQHGTVVGGKTGDLATLGYRATLCAREGVEALLPITFGLADGNARWHAWDDAQLPLIGAAVSSASLVGESADGGVIHEGIELSFDLRAPMRITYRPDLDGGIEFAAPGEHLHIGQIVVLSPDDDFGWLHPASPLDFILDDQLWRSAKVGDWPAPLRRALKRSREPNAFYRRTLERALLARFRQRPMHRQRLLALRYPVHCKDVPDGLIEEVASGMPGPDTGAGRA